MEEPQEKRLAETARLLVDLGFRRFQEDVGRPDFVGREFAVAGPEREVAVPAVLLAGEGHEETRPGLTIGVEEGHGASALTHEGHR